MVFSGNLWSCLKEIKPLFVFDGECWMPRRQCRGIGAHLEFIWYTRCYFTLLRGPQGPSRLVTVFLGTLWSSIKQVKDPCVFDGEQRIALYAMQGNRASSRGEGEVSWFFSSWSGNQGIYSSYGRDGPSKLVFVSKVMTHV